MSLHYLDPEREPRECDRCDGKTMTPAIPGLDSEKCPICWGDGRVYNSVHDETRVCQLCLGDTRVSRCVRCNGTGRLGVEGAEPEIDLSCPDGELWIAEVLLPGKTKCRYFEAPTESAALEAARAAHRAKR